MDGFKLINVLILVGIGAYRIKQMTRRIGLGGIILIVYLAVFLAIYIVLPLVLHVNNPFGSYFPFFFFFPFFLGRRGFRTGRNRKNGDLNNQGENPEDIFQNKYDTGDWDRKHSRNYDEFGIRVKNDLSRYWYYVGMAVIVAAAAILLLTGSIHLNL